MKCRAAVTIALALREGSSSSNIGVYRQLNYLIEGNSFLNNINNSSYYSKSLSVPILRLINTANTNKYKKKNNKFESLTPAHAIWSGVCTAHNIDKINELRIFFNIQLNAAAAQINPDAIHKCLCDFTTSRLMRAARV